MPGLGLWPAWWRDVLVPRSRLETATIGVHVSAKARRNAAKRHAAKRRARRSR